MPRELAKLNKLTKEQRILVEKNINLVHYILHKRKINFNEYEDFFQSGVFGLCLAAQRFDVNKSKFATFAFCYINGYLQRYYRDYATGPIRPKRTDFADDTKPEYLYIDGLINNDGESFGHDYIGICNEEEEIIVNLELEALKKTLTERECLMLDLTLTGNTQREVACELNLSQPQISRTLKKLQNKINEHYKV